MKNIETVICDIINCPKSIEIKNNFLNLKQYMGQHNIYKQLLDEYNIAGIKIAESIEEDYYQFQDNEIILALYNNYILPINTFITENKDYGISKFNEMIEVLENYYNISASSIEEEKKLKLEPPKYVKMKKLGTHPSYRF